MRRQRGFEILRAHAEGGGQSGAQRRVARQEMGLFVFPVLQRVFGAAQEPVGILQAARVLRRNQAGDAFGVQGGQQSALLQCRHAAAADQLRQLHHEFDFADAAIAQLDIVGAVDAVAGGSPPLPVLADALAQGAQGGQGVEVEILAVDEGHAQAFQLTGLGGAVAALERLRRHQARLEPCVAFPFAALADQIVLQRV